MELRLGLLLTMCVLTAGCEQLGIPTPAATAARTEADAKAIGGACRHAGRAIEDCYTLNKKAEKAAMYAGWREMNEYMRDNKMEPVAPVIKPEPAASAPAKPAASAAKAETDAEAEEEDEDADAQGDAPAKGGGAGK